MTSKPHGYFVISLDFELFWGMTDAATLEAYGPNVLGVRTALPRMLELFTKYGIHATWATIGMAMCRNKDELLSLLPPHDLRPKYPDPRMSTYHYIEHTKLGNNESDDPYHYGPSLVEEILKTPNQEFANHTFSHYYAVDGGENGAEILSYDFDAHAQISKTYGVTTTSIVFPRNQVSDEALKVCRKKGMTAYRGNENHFLYRARGYTEQNLCIRGLRLLDHYINISGYHTYTIQKPESRIQNANIHAQLDAVRGEKRIPGASQDHEHTHANGLPYPVGYSETYDQSVETYSAGVNERSIKEMRRLCVNVPASRFLRPYMPVLKWLEPLRMLRIKRAMTHAAKRGKVFHLWWHPHNFGIHQEENFKNLTNILEHYKKLESKYGMQSASMREIASKRQS